ncbi:MAG: MBL fold metallo-hydrolase [Treponema sp.]|nr:MBL fold metallo-hydrolase [Treponema sp.]
MEIELLQTGVLSVNTLVVPCGISKCFVVDPAACSLSNDENCITDYLQGKKLECVAVILTHTHFDHITGINKIKEKFKDAPVCVHEAEVSELQNPVGLMNENVLKDCGAMIVYEQLLKQPPADISLKGDAMLNSFVPSIEGDWKIIHTPGHSPGSICLFSRTQKVLIAGDTIFSSGGFGRTDLYGGDFNALKKSLVYLKQTIPQNTQVFCGHGPSFYFE